MVSQRELASVAELQAAIPDDGALLLWIDRNAWSDGAQQHWGCVVRSTGEPKWEQLPGTGTEQKWTYDDWDLPHKLSASAGGNASPSEIASRACQIYNQRIARVEKYLDGVKRLYVVPVDQMAGVPVEVITDQYTISYVPSGTFLARVKVRPRANGTSLLALGDPVIPHVEAAKEPALPPGGLLITQVLPGGNAAQARLQTGDVLLRYAGAELTSVEQLNTLIQKHGQESSVAVTVWRDGQTARREIGSGKLGVLLDRQPAPEALAAKHKTDQMLLALARGGTWTELPGTAAEVSRLMTLVNGGEATVLTRSAASEQQLEELRSSGKLAQFRYLHFATHGEPNNAKSFESALILSQDQISRDVPSGGAKYYDGRLTANEVLENWQLNADLVTLSACESALGRPGGGDGLLGFAQAFLLAGARAVCLSLWKVDDTATALLMDRFYQNLLGKRAGLSQPLPKADALAEAKRWLRNLSLDDATKLTADLTNSVARGKNEKALKLTVPSTDANTAAPDDHPFAHPRYWAAFILIGDPR
ncbi:MAG TPA: CHAT domain-containing protein [Pirellulales bacterium]|nr:CHAT domain-containing protein [Pirellulales bacterium]